MFKNLEIAKEVVAGMDQQVADIQSRIQAIQAGDELLEKMPEQIKQLNDSITAMSNAKKYLYLATDAVKAKFPDVVTAAIDKVNQATSDSSSDDSSAN